MARHGFPARRPIPLASVTRLLGAALLLIFLALATYYFHDFWTFEDAQERGRQVIQFLKNLALMGAMLIVMGRGAGAPSLDGK